MTVLRRLPDLASIGRALFLAGIFLMVTGDWPQSTVRPARWSMPLPWLGWPWLYLTLLAVSFVVLASSRTVRVTRPTTADFLHVPIALLTAAFLLSVGFSQTPALSWWAFGCFLAIVGFMLAVARIVEDEASFGSLSVVLATAALFLAIRVVVWRLDEGLTDRAYHVRNNAWLGKNQIAWVLNLVAPLLLARFLVARARWAALLYGSAWFLAGVALFLVFSSTGAVAFALTTLTLGALNARYWRRWLILLTGFVALAVTLIAVSTRPSTELLDSLLRPDRSESITVRRDIWRQAARMIRDHPIAGIGLGTYDDVAYTRYRAPGHDGYFRYDWYFRRGWHAHSTPLHVLAETGWVGFAAWCYVWFTIVRFLLRRWRDGDGLGRLNGTAALCVVLAFLVHSMTDVLIGARVHASLRMNLTLAFLVLYVIRLASPAPRAADDARRSPSATA